MNTAPRLKLLRNGQRLAVEFDNAVALVSTNLNRNHPMFAEGSASAATSRNWFPVLDC